MHIKDAFGSWQIVWQSVIRCYLKRCVVSLVMWWANWVLNQWAEISVVILLRDCWIFIALQTLHLVSVCKIKVKLPPCLIKYHAMKTYWGMEMYDHAFLTSALGGEWSASRLGRFTPGVTTPETRWIGGCVGPRAGRDAVAKIKSHAPPGNRTPVVQPVS
jgi:hypothetical protein